MRKTGQLKFFSNVQKLTIRTSFWPTVNSFYNTSLGALYQAIPFDALSKQVAAPQRAISDKGCKPWFDVKGGISLLMVTGCLLVC